MIIKVDDKQIRVLAIGPDTVEDINNVLKGIMNWLATDAKYSRPNAKCNEVKAKVQEVWLKLSNEITLNKDLTYTEYETKSSSTKDSPNL